MPRERPVAAAIPFALAGLVVLVAVSASPASAQIVLPQPPAPSPASLEGRQVVLVTGSTSGLGREVALAMGERGAHVIVHGRNRERGLEVAGEINAGAGSASFYGADFASLAQVRALGEAVLRDYERVDVLVNNAGIWLSGEDERYESQDGIELSFQVNYLAGYLLTEMVLPIVPRSGESRIVNVSSGAQTAIDFEDPMIERGYSGGRSYAQSKLAQVMHAFDLAEELEGTGITVNVLHPASLMDTRMVIEAGVTPRSSVDDGLEAVMNLIVREDLGSGVYYSGTRVSRADPQAYDEEARAALRRLSDDLIGA
jgi:NAD(P)-dependent dehydrogenase (short-subunit alcohol dehydrogenase family)